MVKWLKWVKKTWLNGDLGRHLKYLFVLELSAQGELDNYCKDIVQAAHKDCAGNIYARFGTDKDGGENRWRCYKNIKDGKKAKACVGENGNMKNCQEPDPAGGHYCTDWDGNMKQIMGQFLF